MRGYLEVPPGKPGMRNTTAAKICIAVRDVSEEVDQNGLFTARVVASEPRLA